MSGYRHLEALLSSAAEAENLVDNNTPEDPAPVEEISGCRSRLKTYIGETSSCLRGLRAELKPLERRIKELEAEEKQLIKERTSHLSGMAANNLSRVGASEAAVRELRFCAEYSESALLAVATLGAGPEAFNALYEELQSKLPDLPPWHCTAEAVAQPERDLLGMCPGGKPHLGDAALEQRKQKRCYCSMCLVDAKLDRLWPELKSSKAKVQDIKSEVRESEPVLRRAKQLLRRLGGLKEEELEGDPVFCGPDRPFEPQDEAAVAAQLAAQAEWHRLESTLGVADFPLRIAFLDKSGSMGFDAVTYDALQLGLHNCLHPATGATLTFLFAAPGQTQIILRRPNDPPMGFNIQLGCATWFNEPILRTLRFLAPVAESLNVQSWLMQAGQPPLQILCLTDGADNCSPQELRSLGDLVRQIKEIKGPSSQERIYAPIVGPLSRHGSLMQQTNRKIPIWMAWIATGMGGLALLQSSAPPEVCLVDAVAAPSYREADALPEAGLEEGGPDAKRGGDDGCSDGTERAPGVQRATAASRARRRMSAARPTDSLPEDALQLAVARPMRGVGCRVRVRPSEPGRAPRSAAVLRAIPGDTPQYDVLYDDETRATVSESQLQGSPSEPPTLLRVSRGGGGGGRAGTQAARPGLQSRTAEPDVQRLQVLSVVDAATSDLAGLMAAHQPKASCLGLEAAMTSLQGSERPSDDAIAGLETKLEDAKDVFSISSEPEIPLCDPDQVLLDALRSVGSTASRMLPENRLVAQRFLAVGMEMMMLGGSLMPEYLADQLAPFADIAQERATRRMSVKPEEAEAWLAELTCPLKELLCHLLRLGLLESSQTPNGEVMQPRPDSRQCFAALRRFFHPSTTCSGVEDALRRAVNRNQRLRPQFSCAKLPAPSSDDGSTCSEAGMRRASSSSSSSEGCATDIGSSRSRAVSLASHFPALPADQEMTASTTLSPNPQRRSLARAPTGWTSSAVRVGSAPRSHDFTPTGLELASPARRLSSSLSAAIAVAARGAGSDSGGARRSLASLLAGAPATPPSSEAGARALSGLSVASSPTQRRSLHVGAAAAASGLGGSDLALHGAPTARPRSPIETGGLLLVTSPAPRRRSSSLASFAGRF